MRRGTGNGLSTVPQSDLVRGFLLHVRAAGRAERTAATYAQNLTMLSHFSNEMGMGEIEHLTREHLEHFLLWCREVRGNSWGGLLHRYRSLSVFYNWLVEEGEIKVSPMAKMKPPRVEQRVQAHYEPDDVTKLLMVTQGGGVLDGRDAALIALLYDTGLRASEACGLRLGDVDWKNLVLHVRQGKGGRERMVPVGSKAGKLLDRYIRRRSEHEPEAPLFANESGGPLTYNALRLALGRRFKAAGVQYHGVHGFRRAFAQQFLTAGGSSLDLRYIAGWQSDSMVRKYVQATEAERAVKSHRALSPLDRLR